MFVDVEPLFLNTTPIDQTKATDAVHAIYRHCNLPMPEILFVGGPTELRDRFDGNDKILSMFDMAEIGHFVTKRGTDREDRLQSTVERIMDESTNVTAKQEPAYGGSSHITVAKDYIYQGTNHTEQLLTDLWDNCYAAATMRNRCYLLERPTVVHTSERGLHCSTGPALAFQDGTECYFHEGVKLSKKHLLTPDTIPLDYIHHSYEKHILIDLMGVDAYLEKVKAWKPDVKGRMKKFHHFHEMIVPGDEELDEFKKQGWGHRHEKERYAVKMHNHSVNGKYGLLIENADHDYELVHFPHYDPFIHPHVGLLFEPEDQNLWRTLNVQCALSHGGCHYIYVSFLNGVFRVHTDEEFAPCRREIAPAWFRAKMFRNQPARYEDQTYGYTLEYDGNKLGYEGNLHMANSRGRSKDEPIPTAHPSLFGGNNQLPYYQFHLDIQSDSWEGLLEKWAVHSFEWLGMCSF